MEVIRKEPIVFHMHSHPSVPWLSGVLLGLSLFGVACGVQEQDEASEEGSGQAPAFEQGFVSATSLSYAYCDGVQQLAIADAFRNAKTHVAEALAYLELDPPVNPMRFTRWFGGYTSYTGSIVRNHFSAIQNALNNESIIVDCSFANGASVSVSMSSSYRIYVSDIFFREPPLGMVSQAGALIRELGIFTDIADLGMHDIGPEGCKQLAIISPALALDNADSHQYFAEQPFSSVVYPAPQVNGYPVGTWANRAGGFYYPLATPYETARRFCRDQGLDLTSSQLTSVRGGTYIRVGENGEGPWTVTGNSDVTMLDQITCRGSTEELSFHGYTSPSVNNYRVGRPTSSTISREETAKQFCILKGHTAAFNSWKADYPIGSMYSAWNGSSWGVSGGMVELFQYITCVNVL